MPKHKSLTDAAVKRIKTPKQGSVDHFDLTYPALHLRVRDTGRKTWGYYCRHDGQQLRIRLGAYPHMSVAEAHDAWRRARDDIAAGRDPRPKPAPSATDFKSVFEEWIKRDQADNRSLTPVKRNIERDVLPKWGHREITDIGRRDALDVIDAVRDRGHLIAARRLHARLHRLFKWALGRGIIQVNPLNGVDKPGGETKRERVLTDDELVKVMIAAEKIGYPYGPAFRLLALTGARREEIGGLKWSEISESGDAIHLEGSRTKTGVPHIIPLSTAAAAILKMVPQICGVDFVFTSGKAAISGWSKAKAELDDFAQIAPWRTHDLRRTVATGLQKIGTPLTVTEAVLGHVAGSRGGVVGVYQRHTYADEKRTALETWGARVVDLIEGRTPGKVQPLRRSADS
jgi:integrase